jgi:isopentenyl diphosphate isomerase/L-lactate dehydrogenase-like FMN-dependent dehydrogenase
MSAKFATATEMIVMAKRALSDDEWDYINGAAETETSLRRNRQALDCLALRPRILRDVREPDLSSTFQGAKLRMPVVLAPMGGLQRFTPNGGNDVDDAAEEFGLINFISTVTAPSLEEISANSPHPKVFQIYVRGDDDWIRDLVRRVVKANYWGVALTVDSAFYGNRERLHPSLIASRRVPARDFQKGVTWDTLKVIQDEIGDTPFMLKGIQTAEDAAMAVEHGVQVVYISNHGGRQLDYTLGNIDMLPEVVAAVDGKAEVVVDGGFTRGTDIVKAMAMGATAVGIGRLQAWALAAGGKDGLVALLHMLENEIHTTMGLIGIKNWGELNDSYIAKTIPVREAHEHSAFPHLGGRLN